MVDSDRRQKGLDLVSTLTIVVTLVLFAIAAFEKGLTHDLLLEAGVLLVSIKLVIASYQARLSSESVERKLDELLKREP
jgi:hypothetical protein